MHTHFQQWPSEKEARLLQQHASPDVPQPEAEQPDPSLDQTDAMAAQVAETTIQGRDAERVDEEVVKNLCIQIQDEIDEINASNMNDGQKNDRIIQLVTDWNDKEVHHFGYHVQYSYGQVYYSKLDADSTYYQSPEVKQMAAEVQNAGRRLRNVMGVVGAERPDLPRGSPQYKYQYAITKQRLQNEYNTLKQRLQMMQNGYSYQEAMNATGGQNLNVQNNQQTNTGNVNTANTVVDDAAEQQNILRNAQGLLTKWQNCKTQKDRDFCEGLMMMQGIDVDASDLKNNEMKVAPREARSLTMLMGLLRAAKAFFSEKGNDLPPDDESTSGTAKKKPEDLTNDERSKETDDNKKRIDDLKKNEKDLTKEIQDIENEQAGKKSATGEEPSEEDVKKLKGKKEELEKVKEEIKKLEERNEELKNAPEKKEEEGDDDFVQKFRREKKEASEELHKGIQEFAKELTPEKLGELMESIGSLFKIDTKELKAAVEEMKKNLPKMIEALEKFVSNLLDAVDLEKVSDGKYRLTFDTSKMEPVTFDGKDVFTMGESDVKEAFPGLFTERVGGKMATKPMSKLEVGLALRSVR